MRLMLWRILLKCGIKTLILCKRVCKSWRDFIESKEFAAILPKEINHLTILIERFPNFKWNYTILSNHPLITEKYVLDHFDKPWDIDILSRNSAMSLGILPKQNFTVERYTNILKHKCVSLKSIANYGNFSFKILSSNPNVTADLVLAHQDKSWDYDELSKNENMTFSVILKLKDKPWNFTHISSKSYITWQIVRSNPMLPWKYDALTINPNITYNIIIENPDRPWKLEDCLKNVNITAEMALKFHINMDTISASPKLTDELVLKYRHRHWNIPLLTKNDKISFMTFKQLGISIACKDISAHPQIKIEHIFDRPDIGWCLKTYMCNVNMRWKFFKENLMIFGGHIRYMMRNDHNTWKDYVEMTMFCELDDNIYYSKMSSDLQL